MGALILKSGNALNADVESFDYTDYKNRVIADGGIIHDPVATKEAINYVTNNPAFSSANIASATSFQWGVKFNNGLPVKLYSLFNPDGDLTLDILLLGALEYDVSSNAFPVLNFKGADGGGIKNNGYESMGEITMGKGVASATVVQNNLPLGVSGYYAAIYPMSTPSLASTNSLLRYGNSGKGLKKLALGNGTNTISATTTQSELTAWNKDVIYRNNSNLDIINNGTTSNTATATAAAVTTGLTLTVGRSISDNPSVMKYSAAMNAKLAENWLLKDVDKSSAENLSTYIASKYS